MMERLRDERDESVVASEGAQAYADALLRAARPHPPSPERKERVRRALRAAAIEERRSGPFAWFFSSNAVPLGAAAAAASAVAIAWVVFSEAEPPPLPEVATVAAAPSPAAPVVAGTGATPQREASHGAREKWRVVARVAPGRGEPLPAGSLPAPAAIITNADDADDALDAPAKPRRSKRALPVVSDDELPGATAPEEAAPPAARVVPAAPSGVEAPTAAEESPLEPSPALEPTEATEELPAPATAQEPALRVPTLQPQEKPALAPVPSRAAPHEGSDETMLVLRATRALRADKDPAAASQLLESYLRFYPRGALAEEALGLAIEAAAELGAPRAAALAADYLKRFPAGRFVTAAKAALRRFR